MRVTITDIAKRAGVSNTTVSRVLNDKPDVDGNTRARILQIIQEAGYVRNPAARGLIAGKTNLIGFLVPSLHRPWTIEIIRGVAEGIEDTSYELVLYTTTLMEKSRELFGRALSNGLTDGLLVMLPPDGKQYLSSLFDRGFPIVLIDDRVSFPKLPTVMASSKEGAHQATRHLINLGHQTIGFIAGPMEFACCCDRLEGYKLALAEAHIDFSPKLVAHGDFSEASGVAQMEAWLDSADVSPSAVFASSDEMAFGAMKVITSRGMKIPNDVSIVGFDDIPFAAWTVPPLTTVRQPLHDIGRKAVEMLIRQIEGESLDATKVELMTELIIRASTCERRR
ncbi:MAG: LacI family DNA-binding transcriptional regulator [Spirochaetota bacterium]